MSERINNTRVDGPVQRMDIEIEFVSLRFDIDGLLKQGKDRVPGPELRKLARCGVIEMKLRVTSRKLVRPILCRPHNAVLLTRFSICHAN